MKRTLAALMITVMIGHITAFAAFPTFVWTEEYRSELYAVEMAEDGVDDTTATTDAESITAFLVFDTVDDEPATPSDLDTTAPDEGMNDGGDDEIEEDPDAVAQTITPYEVEPGTAEDAEPAIEQQEGQEGQEEPDEGMNDAGDDEIEEEPDSVAQTITSYEVEPGTAEDAEPAIEQQEAQEGQEEPDEGMNATGNEPSEDADTDVIFITSYDIEFEVVEDGMEPVEALEEDTEPTIDTQEEDIEPEQEG